MTKEEHLLTLLAEECVETAQRATKALRFGLTEIQEGQGLTNAQRIVYEFNDIYTVMCLLRENQLINKVIDLNASQLKEKKIEKWMEYSEQLGTIKHTN